MKVILSRKGFDNQYGKQPSPIMPDGTLLSLPIPSKHDKIRFVDLSYNEKSYYDIIKELNPKSSIKESYTCHLDPDLRFDCNKRNGDWRPLFGQTGSAYGHLKSKGVCENDIFLFFGTFRMTELIDGRLQYIPRSPEQHIIFGYLQVGEMHTNFESFPEYAKSHPHTTERFKLNKRNCLYEARQQLSFNNDLPGAGVFNYHPDLVLTKNGESKSRWNLPSFFTDLKISYHSKKSFTSLYFQSAAKGQEFIIEHDDRVVEWVHRLINSTINNKSKH